MNLSFNQLRDLTHGRFGVIDAPCPLCGPERRSAVNQRRKTLRVWCFDPAFLTFHCPRCKAEGWAAAQTGTTVSQRSPADFIKIKADIAIREAAHERMRLIKAHSLWCRSQLAAVGTPPHTYLRGPRGYSGPIPATIRYLPASLHFPAAMITAIGMAHETEPGDLTIDDGAMRGVHLTSLKADGSGKAGTERDKIMIGKSIGSPIVVAPLNDGLGLAITEGIEDALSVHEATGLGAWAAGSASRMPALASIVPSYVDCVTLVADADEVGRSNAHSLAVALWDRHDVRLIVPLENRRAA